MHKHTELLSMFWDRVAPLYDFFGNAFNRLFIIGGVVGV